ncbi:uncharacterized protein LOC115632585 isoform X3 [Scaptodrosophila lebanonensis]|nr:uncharacterized protein LOC115632585 isoform X3 [Scaptodrosophila lebanonensis]
MRHRLPKNEQDQSFYFNQQSEDCEKTVVEPDLTNGLIRRMQDSDEDYDEDDTDAAADGDGEAYGGDGTDGSRDGLPTPPAAHQQTQVSTTPLATGALKAEEEAFASHQQALLKAGLLRAQLLELEREAQDLSKKSTQCINAATARQALETPPAHSSPPPMVTTTTTSLAASTMQGQLLLPGTVLAPASTTTSASSCTSSQATTTTTLGVAKRSVSPPPLYNKAHHPLATHGSAGLHAAKERGEEYSAAAAAAAAGGGPGSEHLNFTQHSYANGLIPALKLKRPRLSEDSNFNGSSTMDVPLVPEDDDYHYLLSLHPYMKQLTAAQKLRIRTKIQKLIFKELYKEDLEESK